MDGRDLGTEGTPPEARHDYWGVVLDAPDATALGRFYGQLLGWTVDEGDLTFVTVAPPDGVAYLAAQTSPDYTPPVWPNAEGAQQMMCHLDFEVSDLAAAVSHAVRLGAREAQFQPQDNVRVMLDPAGHPFCLYRGTDSGTV